MKKVLFVSGLFFAALIVFGQNGSDSVVTAYPVVRTPIVLKVKNLFTGLNAPLYIDSSENIFCNGETFIIQQMLDEEYAAVVVCESTVLFKNKNDVTFIQKNHDGSRTLYTKVLLLEGGRPEAPRDVTVKFSKKKR